VVVNFPVTRKAKRQTTGKIQQPDPDPPIGMVNLGCGIAAQMALDIVPQEREARTAVAPQLAIPDFAPLP
jgi:hypothetical protein